MSYSLSLDETADPARDEILELEGIRFVAERRQRHLLPGLRVELQTVFGREGLVAHNPAFEAGGC